MNRLTTFVVIFFASFCLAFAQPKASSSAEIKLPATLTDSIPWFAVRELNDTNSPFTKNHLSRIAEGNNRVALVYFATWCLPCRAGVKRLAENASALQQNKMQVVLVNIGERDEEQIKNWVEKVGASDFKVIMDPFKRLTEGFGLVKEGEDISLPRSVVVDGKLKPLFMLGEEGSDWPQILWKKK